MIMESTQHSAISQNILTATDAKVAKKEKDSEFSQFPFALFAPFAVNRFG